MERHLKLIKHQNVHFSDLLDTFSTILFSPVSPQMSKKTECANIMFYKVAFYENLVRSENNMKKKKIDNLIQQYRAPAILEDTLYKCHKNKLTMVIIYCYLHYKNL